MGLFDYFDAEPIAKRVYEVEYKKMKAEGYPFHPFATWKDTLAALFVLLLLSALTLYYGVELGPPASPTAEWLPRPEWYFMFLFQLLKYFPGPLSVLAVAVIPGVAGAALALIPFYDRTPYRSPSRRPVAVGIMCASMFSVFLLTFLAYWDDAHDPHAVKLAKAAQEATEASMKGHDAPAAGGHGAAEDPGKAVFANNCAMCHQATGTGIPNVALYDKKFLEGRDLKTVITKGKLDKGMPAFGEKLKAEEIDAVIKHLQANAK